MKSIKLEAHEQDYVDCRVGHVEWNVSKRGLLKPRLVLKEPVDFDGAEVTYATLNNAAHVVKWGIRPGRPVRLVRSGDVIPRVVAVYDAKKWWPLVKSVRGRLGDDVLTKNVDQPGIKDSKIRATLPRQCPECRNRLRWNSTKVDLFCDNESCSGRSSKQVLSFFRTLGVDDVGLGTIDHLVQSGLTTVPAILNRATVPYLSKLEGYGAKKAETVAKAIAGALRDAPLHKIMHASGAFSDERTALGSTRLHTILQAVGAGMIERATDAQLRKALSTVKSIGPSNVQLLLAGLPEWRELWAKIKRHHTESSGPKTLAGISVCFTGFRDEEMQRFIEKNGGVVKGMSKSISVLFAASTSSVKAQKADALRIPIVAQAEAWKWLRERAYK